LQLSTLHVTVLYVVYILFLVFNTSIVYYSVLILLVNLLT